MAFLPNRYAVMGGHLGQSLVFSLALGWR